MARPSLLFGVAMRRRQPQERRCSYVVVLERGADVRELSGYLSQVGTSDCDVVILDPAPQDEFEENRRVLRWVGRHLEVRAETRTPAGAIDVLRAAADVAACEKVIVAAVDVRYTPLALEQLCQLLDMHEVVEPQDYLDPLPWWGGIEAGRILVHRGIEPGPDHGTTFGFRRSAVRSLRNLTLAAGDPVRRLVAHGAEVYPACDVFVKRRPPALSTWLGERPRIAGNDFGLPVKTAFFFALAPMLLLIGLFGGAQLAGGYAGIIAFASFALAVRGRSGAASFFPMRAALFAPLWIFERSVSVYWALFRKLRGLETQTHEAEPASDQPAATRRSSL
jgi:hypothetical protein